MRVFYSVILTLFFTSISFAQSISVFPDSNAIWVTGYHNWDMDHLIDNDYSTSYCMGKGDTTIGSYTYSKINYCGGAYKGATRTESRKVYYVPKDSIQYFLLYDFSVEEGDVLYNVYHEDETPALYDHLTVGPVSEIMINDKPYKEIHVGGHSWIEGIGNTNGLFLGIETVESFFYNELACMSQNDTTVFPYYSLQSCNQVLSIAKEQPNETLAAFPNPMQYITTLQWNNLWDDTSIRVYNACGNTIDPKISYPSSHNTQIDLTGYPEGIYHVIVNTANKKYTAKILKQ